MKIFLTWLSLFKTRKALSLALAIIVAAALKPFFGNAFPWLLLSAFFISQTLTPGVPTRQSFYQLLIIIFALIFSYLLMRSIEFPYPQLIGITLFVISAQIFLSDQNQSLSDFIKIMLFSMITMISLLSPNMVMSVQEDFLAVLVGGLIAIVCNQFTKSNQDFKFDILPIVGLLSDHIALQKTVSSEYAVNQERILNAQNQINKVLSSIRYPNWIYAPGFNPGLRSSLRFFLIKLEQVIDLFFVEDYLVCQSLKEIPTALIDQAQIALDKNAQLLVLIGNYFRDQFIHYTDEDFTQDIPILEKKLQEILPSNLELLNFSKDYIALIAWVRNLKDIRSLLLELLMALPAKQI